MLTSYDIVILCGQKGATVITPPFGNRRLKEAVILPSQPKAKWLAPKSFSDVNLNVLSATAPVSKAQDFTGKQFVFMTNQLSFIFNIKDCGEVANSE